MGKVLVTYFSTGGVTKRIAEEIAEATGGDLYEIRPAEPYSGADLDYMNKKSRCSLEMTDPGSRPLLADKDADIAGHDVIYVGYPIWWGVAPHVINSFLEAYDFEGKTIIPFATSGGSGIGNVKKYLGSSAPGAVIKDGKRLGGNEDLEAMKVWTEGMTD